MLLRVFINVSNYPNPPRVYHRKMYYFNLGCRFCLCFNLFFVNTSSVVANSTKGIISIVLKSQWSSTVGGYSEPGSSRVPKRGGGEGGWDTGRSSHWFSAPKQSSSYHVLKRTYKHQTGSWIFSSISSIFFFPVFYNWNNIIVIRIVRFSDSVQSVPVFPFWVNVCVFGCCCYVMLHPLPRE